MNADDLHRQDRPTPDMCLPAPAGGPTPHATRAFERTVDYVLDDCFFMVGQTVGARKALDYEAVVWWRDHYRSRFLAAMQDFGDRWREDRDRVGGVALMLAERAVRHAGDAASIGREAARLAAADVERYCQVHARRAARRGQSPTDDELARIAGYWCIRVER